MDGERRRHPPGMDRLVEHTRDEEVLQIRSSRNLKKILKGAFANIDHTGITLSTLEFMMMSNLYQINANYVFQFLELALVHDAVAVCVIYLILTSMVGVPLSMLLTFMASYSKKSFLEFWQCVPLFEGLGYSAGIIRLCIEIFNVLHAGIALVLLAHVRDSDFAEYARSCECAIGTKYERDCVRARQNLSRRCSETQPYTAFQVYYRVRVTTYAYYEDWKVPALNVPCFWAVAFVWAVIFAFACLGMKRMHRIATYPQFFFLFAIVCLSVSVICVAENGAIKDTRFYENPLLRFDFWVILILHTAEVNFLGNTIWIGTMKPDSLHPKFASLLNPPVKMLIFMSLLGMMSIVTKDNALYYQLDNLDCLSLSADDVLFVLVPDVLLRYKPWKASLFLWYGSLFYFLIMPPIYSVLAFLISLEARFPVLIPYRALSCSVVCTVGLAFTLPLVTEIGALVVVIWKYFGLSILISSLMLLVNLAIFFVYTTDQVIDDYTFTFGYPPEKYWTTLWKCCPLFSFFGFLFAITFQSTNVVLATHFNMVLMASYVHSGLVMAPIIVIAVVKFCKHVQHRRLSVLIRPSPEWGPKDERLHSARQNYYPARNVRFRVGTTKCKHKCSVVNHEAYRKERSEQKEKLGRILGHFGRARNMKKVKVRYSVGHLEEKSRSQELPLIKRERQLLLKSLIGRDFVRGAVYFELTVVEFIVFSTVQHANLNYLLLFINMSYRFGTMPTCVAFLMFKLIFGLPLYMLYLFLSSYTKRSFLTVWECIPIIEGFGYALAIAKVAYEVSNVTIASYCIKMLMHLLRLGTKPIKKPCVGFDVDERCVAFGSVANVNCTDDKGGPILIGIQYFFRRKMLHYDQYGGGGCCEFNLSQLAVFTGLWFLIFFVCIFGTERTVKILFKMITISTAVVFTISLYVVLHAHSYPMTPRPPPMPFRDFAFWIELVLHTNTPAALVNTLWLGTLLPRQFSARDAALVLASMKFAICMLLMCFTSVVIHGTLHHYAFSDPDCMAIHSVDVFIAFVPDILFQLHFGLLIAVFWYLSIASIAIVNPIFCVLAIVDSLCERRPELNPRRMIVYAASCTFGFALSVPYTLNISHALLSFFTVGGMLLLKATFLLLVNLSLIFLYSITRIVEDYTFTYGSPPHAYFKSNWKMIPIISIYIFILTLYETHVGKDNEGLQGINHYLVLPSYVTMGVMVTPIIFVALVKISKQLKYRSFKKLLRPSFGWGPYKREKKDARMLFFPQREIKYRDMSLRCSHNCLAEASSFSQEHSRQMKMLHRLADVEKEQFEPTLVRFIVSQHQL